jgi:hypothetical protein
VPQHCLDFAARQPPSDPPVRKMIGFMLSTAVFREKGLCHIPPECGKVCAGHTGEATAKRGQGTFGYICGGRK